MSTPDAGYSGYVLWHYSPSVPGNVAVSAAFAVLSLGHLFRLFAKRTFFCIPLVVGAAFEVVGYVFRVVAHSNVDSTLPYAIQSLLILLAPILFAASVYMFLGRIVVAVPGGARHSPIRPTRLTKIFVFGDVFCFLTQGAGGGIMSAAKSDSTLKLGENVILAGLVLQILIFAFFVAVAVTWHARMKASTRRSFPDGLVGWEHLLFGLYLVSLLIALRNIFRCVEYGLGQDGYLMRHEWTTFVFDAVLMLLVLLVCWAWYGSGVGIRGQKVEGGVAMESLPSRDSGSKY